MRLPRECCQMQQVIETHLPFLSRSQLVGLVLWVCGTIQAGSACQNAVAAALSTKGNWDNLRSACGNGSTTAATGGSLPDRTGRKSLLRAPPALGPLVVVF